MMDVPDDPMEVLYQQPDGGYYLTKEEFRMFCRVGLLFGFIVIGITLYEPNDYARYVVQGVFVLYVLALLLVPIRNGGDR